MASRKRARTKTSELTKHAPILVTALPSFAIRTSALASPPNIIVLLAADLGWADLSCYGSTFPEPPHLDKHTAHGMRFTQLHSSSQNCQPSLEASMPGRHLARAETNDYSHSACKRGTLLRAEMKRELPLGEVTLAELLHDAGYATRHVGKWHLGESGFLPEKQGFQVNIARNHCGAPTSFLCPYGQDKPEAAKRYHGSPVPVLAEGRQKAEDLCACLTSESMKLITGRKSGGPPSLHLPFYDVHRPIMAKPGLDKKYHAKSCCMGFLARPTLCSRARRLMAGPSARRMVTARRTRSSE